MIADWIEIVLRATVSLLPAPPLVISWAASHRRWTSDLFSGLRAASQTVCPVPARVAV